MQWVQRCITLGLSEVMRQLLWSFVPINILWHSPESHNNPFMTDESHGTWSPWRCRYVSCFLEDNDQGAILCLLSAQLTWFMTLIIAQQLFCTMWVTNTRGTSRNIELQSYTIIQPSPPLACHEWQILWIMFSCILHHTGWHVIIQLLYLGRERTHPSPCSGTLSEGEVCIRNVGSDSLFYCWPNPGSLRIVPNMTWARLVAGRGRGWDHETCVESLLRCWRRQAQMYRGWFRRAGSLSCCTCLQGCTILAFLIM